MQGLFSEFPASSYADWEKQILKDLKGELPDSLAWENENGFKLKAFYNKDETPTVYEPAFLHRDWKVCVQQDTEAKEMNANFLRDLSHGANAISFEIKNRSLEEVLKNVDLELISVNLGMEAAAAPALKNYLDKNYADKELSISLFQASPVNEKSLGEWNAVHEVFSKHAGVKTLTVNATAFTNKNALPYYELALTFSQLIEGLSRNTEIKKDIVIKTSTDSDFFVQIAKLRAYRRLWKLIAKEYNVDVELYVVAETDVNSLSISDAYTNLLRNTLSAMSAILGGCNELVVQSYDHLLKGDSAFSSRMSMNQQFILKHESYFDKIGDVACGSYYIEQLTDALCERALETLKAIESKGGYFKYLESGELSKELEKQNTSKLEAISSGKTTRVGVNKFRNEKEKVQLSSEQLTLLKGIAPHHPLLNYELLQTPKA